MLFLLVLLAGCDVWNSSSSRLSNSDPVQDTTEVVLDDPDAPANVRGEPFSFVSVPETDTLQASADATLLGTVDASDGGILSLKVRYSGGCRDHRFTLVASPSFIETVPVQARARLYHNGRGDRCEALVTDTVRVRLQPLTDAFREQYGIDSSRSSAYDLRFLQGTATVRIRVAP